MGDALEVLVGADGGVSFGPSSATLPTDATTDIDMAFTDLGYVSDAGCVEHIGRTTKPIKNWKGDTVRVVQTDHEVTYKFVLIQTNDDTEAVFYGTDPDLGIKNVQGTRGAWVIRVFDGDIEIRVVVPDGQVTATGDITYKNDEAVAYDVTITAYPDANDVKAFKYRSGGGGS